MQYYKEPELFYLLRHFVKALDEAKTNNIFHGNLNDENIVITEDGNYKM